jgi:hypothetical protein
LTLVAKVEQRPIEQIPVCAYLMFCQHNEKMRLSRFQHGNTKPNVKQLR